MKGKMATYRDGGLTPVEALRIIRAILADSAFGGPAGKPRHAQKLAAAAIILKADGRSRLAWADYKSTCREFGISRQTFRNATTAAEGRYIEVARRGRHGAKQYRILPLQKFISETPVKRQESNVQIPADNQKSAGRSQPSIHCPQGSAGQTDSYPSPNPSPRPNRKRHGTAPSNGTASDGLPFADLLREHRGLCNSAFKAAWREWNQYRKEVPKKLTPSTARRQLALLAAVGPETAVRMIERSIECGWIGLFRPKANAAAGKHGTFTPAKAVESYDYLLRKE